ncbi:hypothetical protein [Spiroplasma ixodetis]|uniref:hypothetical protein n=1 Tax=Spiroplasma ixodetis TaxID=2141 RepID=UPI002577100D|nr:hypothetical protein [Spiroplasma ixodetis]WJG69840.1 hypothetical protein SIXOD_v1c08110 [Spiroplasma ixodetis Y32]
MKIQKLKKINLITLSLFILTILVIFTSLTLIDFFNIKNDIKYIPSFYNHYRKQEIITKENGLIYILTNNKLYFCKHYLFQNIVENYILKSLVQLKIGIVFAIILSPILLFITILLIFLNIYLKIKKENNNFWDAIENCEIINNYYVH